MKNIRKLFLLLIPMFFVTGCISYDYDNTLFMTSVAEGNSLPSNASYIYGAFNSPTPGSIANITYVNTSTKELYTIRFQRLMPETLFAIPTGNYEFFNFSVEAGGSDFLFAKDVTGIYSNHYDELFEQYPQSFSIVKGEVLYFGQCNVFLSGEGDFSSIIEEAENLELTKKNMRSFYPSLRNYIFTQFILKEKKDV